LQHWGAEVTGYALIPPTEPILFETAHVGEGMQSVLGDVRDFSALRAVVANCRPEIVFHFHPAGYKPSPLGGTSFSAPPFKGNALAYS
jgi:hypothetical protein